jgi:acetyl esterase/lipase
MDIAQLTDEAHRAVLELLPPDLMDLTDIAAASDRFTALLAARPAVIPDGVEVDDHLVPLADGHQLVVRVYRSSSARPMSPGLLWIHGGGMVLGDVSMNDGECAAMANELDIVVASVDYRLAPAFPYPVPLDDCYAGLSWFFGAAGLLGLDADRIAIGGASAGGGLAAGLALLARDCGEMRPCFQLLTYPMLDDRNDTPSSHGVTDLRLWNRDANLTGWDAYLNGRAGGDDIAAYAAPSRATDLADLPPAMITVGALDMFLDEDIAYAHALLRAGVPTELHVYPGSFHGANALVPHAAASRRWRRDEFEALDQALNQDRTKQTDIQQ